MSLKERSSPAPLPMLKNVGAAPLIYFDTVPVYGTFGGNLEIELSARMLMSKPDGNVLVDMACTGHLRCSPAAALQLAESLRKAVEMHNKQMEQPSPLHKAALEMLDDEDQRDARPN